ncbi:vWA domain-containing protein [Butyrivibrio sp. LC3010]|uniref:vWA domain-containing protein n=1 Tax=Butyrivibrio sp. LC3010 TaxID=1280680 RepID=UPI0004184DEA|nr:VWA domain-containing protein [Butyrivibrio sp. LC3010]
MRRKMNAISMILSGAILASSVSGCGQSSETVATSEQTYSEEPTYSETTSNNSSAAENRNYDAQTNTAVDKGYEATGNKKEIAEAEVASYDTTEAAEYEEDGYYEGESNDAYMPQMLGDEGCDVPFYEDPYSGKALENNTESYEKDEENGYNITLSKPLSTFAADVDTASYSNVRRMIEDGYTLSEINPDAVRPEEFINYFSYNLNKPEGRDKFGITTEIASCPWNEDHQLMFVGMKTQDIDFSEAPESNLVFLIDVSGSMDEDNKLPLLQKTFKALVDELPDRGVISIVTYSGEEKVVLSGVSMKKKAKIISAIDSLEANGCTNGEAGIQKAYEIAKKNYIKGGINRVILATDGDLNVGISSPDDLEKFITNKKDDGIFLSIMGFGDGNYKDDNLERLADCGNGNYSYIDSLFEGKKVFVDEMGQTLVTVAKDVKLQVEFNPQRVNSYRLIGYENRIMNDADFNDDTKDGGEIGAGHSVVALYEIVPEDSKSAIKLKYQDNKEADNDNSDQEYASEYATVSVRYKEPGADKSQLFSVVVDDRNFSDQGSENIRFAGMVAEFAMILGNSEYKGTASLEDIMDMYKTVKNRDEYKDEFNQLVRMVAKR